MSTAKLVERFIDEVWNQGRMDVLSEVMHEPYDARSLNFGLPPQQGMTRAHMERHVAEFRSAFPDLRMQIERIVESGDRAYVQTRLTGTHGGAFMGLPPTKRKVEMVLSACYTARDGKLAEHEVLVDMLGLLQQLGLAPPMGPPGAPPPGAPQ